MGKEKPCNENEYIKLGTHNFEKVTDYAYPVKL
jgi:hypothetical protein